MPSSICHVSIKSYFLWRCVNKTRDLVLIGQIGCCEAITNEFCEGALWRSQLIMNVWWGWSWWKYKPVLLVWSSGLSWIACQLGQNRIRLEWSSEAFGWRWEDFFQARVYRTKINRPQPNASISRPRNYLVGCIWEDRKRILLRRYHQYRLPSSGIEDSRIMKARNISQSFLVFLATFCWSWRNSHFNRCIFASHSSIATENFNIIICTNSLLQMSTIVSLWVTNICFTQNIDSVATVLQVHHAHDQILILCPIWQREDCWVPESSWLGGPKPGFHGNIVEHIRKSEMVREFVNRVGAMRCEL